MFENPWDFYIVHVYDFTKFFPQTIILPLLSPEMNKFLLSPSIKAKAETDPSCPDLAILHLSSYQK
jgi:hypothetical protein